MISQADIIKTLINKNCTDESVMNTALSTQYAPPKLLEKLTEAERFDVALDISMKLRLDVTPLWRTWAMRCLLNRNFQGAREKFRHCFLRLKRPGGAGGRPNLAYKNLLVDITRELSKMSETQLSLAEEVELIKRRAANCLQSSGQDSAGSQNLTDQTARINQQTENLVILKPKIYSECLYYLKEYGTFEDSLVFYIDNYLWEEAVQVLLKDSTLAKINMDKFFIQEILLRSASMGCLSDLVGAFLKLDAKIILSVEYFRAIYNFCSRNRRYNLLYYIQNAISDYIAAARVQIEFFFLKPPATSYRELNQRLPSLMRALKNYNKFLDVYENTNSTGMGRTLDGGASETIVTRVKATQPKCDDEKQDEQSFNSLFSSMSKDQVENQIKLLTLQIDITRNFAINEVTGCTNGIDLSFMVECEKTVDCDSVDKLEGETKQTIIVDQSGTNPLNEMIDMAPVTLFEKSESRKTFLAALILIYYDLACSTYFSKSGLDLANKIIQDHKLDKVKVFKTAMRVIIEDETCDILESASILLTRIKEDYLASNVATIKDNSPRVNKGKPQMRQKSDRVKITDKSNQSSNRNNDKSRSISVVGSNIGGVQQTKAATDQTKPTNTTTTTMTTTMTTSMKDDGNDINQDVRRNSPPVISAAVAAAAASPPVRHTSLLSKLSPVDGARAICDEVIRDSIKSCSEADYKMELAKLLSAEAKIELYIELGKLSNAQRLACTMNRADYVENIIEEASKLNQNHVKTVCQLWLAKHETRNFIR